MKLRKSLLLLFCIACVFGVIGFPIYAQDCDTSLTGEDYKTQGDELLDAGDNASAIERYSCALELEPAYPAAYVNRGVAYYFMGDYLNAIADYTRALELQPDEINGLNNRGWAYVRLRRPEEAIPDFLQVIDTLGLSDNSEALDGLGHAYYQQEDFDNALEYWNRYMEVAGENASQTVIERLEYIHVQQAVDDALCDLSLSVNVYTQKTVELIQEQNVKDALQQTQCAVLVAPDDALVYANRGYIYQIMGNYNAAFRDLNQAIALNPEGENGYYNRAGTYQAIGRYDLAVYDFIQTILLSSGFAGNVEAINQLAYSYMQLGDYSNAFLAYERLLISLGREDLPQGILDNIAFVEQQVDKTVSDSLTCSGEEHTGDVKLWSNAYADRSLRNRTEGDYETALTNMSCAVVWLPFSPVRWSDRAFIQIQLEDYDEAFESLDQALFYDPDYSMAFAYLGLLYHREDNIEDGLKAVDEALRIDPANDRALVIRGDMYYELERFDEALADYQQAIDATTQFVGRLPEYVFERVAELGG